MVTDPVQEAVACDGVEAASEPAYEPPSNAPAAEPEANPDALNPSRSDVVLWRAAAKGGWNVPEPLRVQAILALARILDKPGEERLKLGAIRALAALDRCDLIAERIRLMVTAQEARRAADDVTALREFLNDHIPEVAGASATETRPEPTGESGPPGGGARGDGGD